MEGNLLNWGFEPIGTPLGSESSQSMPQDQATGMENPIETTERMLGDFTEQVARRYGNVSDPSGSLWDPRGNRALSSEVADYRTTDMMRPDEIPLSIADLSPELMGGEAVLAPYAASNQLDSSALYDAGLGLSEAGAASLADSLSVVDPAFLNMIHLPPQYEPKIVNEMGLVTDHGGLPDAFFDAQSGVLHKGMPEAVDRVLAGQGEYQYVDENGVVNKYAQGTGPYDAPGFTRPGSLLGALPGTRFKTREGTMVRAQNRMLTPAVIASTPRLAMRLGYVPGAGPGMPAPLSRATASRVANTVAGDALSKATGQQQSTGGTSTQFMDDTSGKTPAYDNTNPSVTGDASDTSGDTGAPNGGGYSDEPVYDPLDTESGYGDVPAPTGGKRKCPWIMIAIGVATAAAGAYVMSRKKGKK